MRKPEVFINCKFYRDTGESLSRPQWKSKRYKSYRELKKSLVYWITESEDGQATVYRSRRGQWGEWFEVWKMVNGKLKIIKEGWV